MRVAIDGKALVEPRAGVARYVSGVLAGLEEIGGAGHPVELLRPAASGSTLLWTLGKLQAASGRFDLLHCPFYYTPLAPRCPVTVAIHDVLPLTHPEWFPRSWLSPIRWLMPRSARRAAGVVTFSTSTARLIPDLLGVPGDRVRVIPHGVDHRRFHPRPPQEVNAVRQRNTGGRPYLLQVGAMEPRRGIDLTLAAMRHLHDRWPGLVLLLVGGVRATVPELEEPPYWVVRPGHLPDGELPALYTGAEAVLGPSRGEGFDLPLLEALACGAPVVASDIAVHVEHFGAAVELFPSGEAEALAHAIATVLDDSGRAAALRTAGPNLAQNFTWERSAAAHLRLWRETTGG